MPLFYNVAISVARKLIRLHGGVEKYLKSITFRISSWNTIYIMISNILPLAALLGTAIAVCPLSVEITGATAHVAQVAVTNTGSETITVFKGNTVLSPHATKDLVVADAGTFISSI